MSGASAPQTRATSETENGADEAKNRTANGTKTTAEASQSLLDASESNQVAPAGSGSESGAGLAPFGEVAVEVSIVVLRSSSAMSHYLIVRYRTKFVKGVAA
jgi:hypothetical protein